MMSVKPLIGTTLKPPWTLTPIHRRKTRSCKLGHAGNTVPRHSGDSPCGLSPVAPPTRPPNLLDRASPGAQASPSTQYGRYIRMASEDHTRPEGCIDVRVVAMYQGTSINFQSEGYDVAQRVIWDAATMGVVGLRLNSMPDGVTLRFKLEFSSVKDAKTAISYGALPQGWIVPVQVVPYHGRVELKPSQVASTPKILAGFYVRTISVLRNIPNKLACWECVQALDSDLRIDFSRVGCAGVT